MNKFIRISIRNGEHDCSDMHLVRSKVNASSVRGQIDGTGFTHQGTNAYLGLAVAFSCIVINVNIVPTVR